MQPNILFHQHKSYYMEKKNVKKLPDSITLEDEFNKYRSSWLAVIGSAQKAYEDLLSDKDVGDYLPDFENLSAKWISDFVAEKIDAVMKSPAPYSSRMETVGLWRNLEKDINGKIKKVQSVYNLDPQAKVELKGCHITITNMDEILKEKSKFIVPYFYKEYYAKIANVAEAIEELRAYEKPHNLPSIDINIMMRFVEPLNFIGWRRNSEELERFKFTGCPRH